MVSKGQYVPQNNYFFTDSVNEHVNTVLINEKNISNLA